MSQEFLGQCDLRGAGEEVGDVTERGQLAGNHRRDERVGVAQCVHCDTAEKVQVFLAVGVPHEAAGATHQDALRSAEDTHERGRVTGKPVSAITHSSNDELCAASAAMGAPPASRCPPTPGGPSPVRLSAVWPTVPCSCVHFLVGDYLGANARGRKGFQQHRVREPAVHDVCALHSFVDGFEARSHFRDHA